MTTLLISTVVRHTQPGEPSGYLYTVDLETRQATGRCAMIEPPLTHADPNPRGGMRGAKGISFDGECVFVSNHSSVFEFDNRWRLLREIKHPSCSGIHDIHYRDGGIWITSSRNDLVFELDRTGNIRRHINLRALPGVRRALGWKEPNLLSDDAIRNAAIDFRDPRTHKYETYDGAHVNSVAFLPDGDLLIMMGLVWSRQQTALFTVKKYLKKFGLWRLAVWANHMVAAMFRTGKPAMNTEMAVNLATGKSAVVRCSPGGGEVSVPFVVEQANTPAHSLLVNADGSVLLDCTSSGEIVRFDPETGHESLRLKVTDKFLRGLCRIDAATVAAGCREEFALVDLERGAIKSRIPLSENPNEAVYDIKILPPAFATVPDHLDEVPAASAT